MTDEHIGNYRIVGNIGAGGMASVHLAVHRDVPNLKVVLKKLSDPRLVDRFKREADKLALLDGQSGICQIKHFFDCDGDFYIAMEFIDGQNLDERIRSPEGLDQDRALGIVMSVLRTLDFAHRQGVVHRDIKPTNIMIDRGGQVKVIDFGIAKGKSDPDLTTVGTSLGSPRYMAPEQFSPDENTDWARCDIYAVGVTLYYALTKRLPFASKDLYALRDEKMRGEVVPPSQLDPTLKPELDAVVLRALDVDPARRYGEAAEMLAELTVIAAGGRPAVTTSPPPLRDAGATRVMDAPPVAPPPAPPTPPPTPPSAATATPPPAPAPRRRPPTAVLAGAGAVVVVLAAVGIYLGTRGGGGAAPDPNAVDLGPRNQVADVVTDTVPPPVPVVSGTVTVIIEPPGGALYLNGDLVGRDLGTHDLELDPGRYQLRVTHAGSVEGSREREIEVIADQRVNVPFAFTRKPAPPPAITGSVRVGSRPSIGHSIYVDGKLREEKTQARLVLTTGSHLIKVVAGVAKELEIEVLVQPGENDKYFFDFTKMEIDIVPMN